MEIENEVRRFNWYFALFLIIAATVDLGLVLAFARFLMFLRSL